MSKILTQGKKLVGLDGKTPLSTKAKAEVLMQIKWTAAGGRQAPQYLQILQAEVDGDINLVNHVIMSAAEQLIHTLVKLGVVTGLNMGQKPT